MGKVYLSGKTTNNRFLWVNMGLSILITVSSSTFFEVQNFHDYYFTS